MISSAVAFDSRMTYGRETPRVIMYVNWIEWLFRGTIGSYAWGTSPDALNLSHFRVEQLFVTHKR